MHGAPLFLLMNGVFNSFCPTVMVTILSPKSTIALCVSKKLLPMIPPSFNVGTTMNQVYITVFSVDSEILTVAC